MAKEYFSNLSSRIATGSDNLVETDQYIEFDVLSCAPGWVVRSDGASYEVTAEVLKSAASTLYAKSVNMKHSDGMESTVGVVVKSEWDDMLNGIRTRLRIFKTQTTELLCALIKSNPSPVKDVSIGFNFTREVLSKVKKLFRYKTMDIFEVALVNDGAVPEAQRLQNISSKENDMEKTAEEIRLEQENQQLKAQLQSTATEKDVLTQDVASLKKTAEIGRQYKERLQKDVKKFITLVETDKSPVLGMVDSADVETLEQLSATYSAKAKETMKASSQKHDAGEGSPDFDVEKLEKMPLKDIFSNMTKEHLEQMNHSQVEAFGRRLKTGFAAISQSTNPELFPAYYNRKLLSFLQANLVVAQDAQPSSIPAGAGVSMQWLRMALLAVDTTPITGLPSPEGEDISNDNVNATCQEYGKSIDFYDYADLTSFYPLADANTMRLSINARQTLERIVFETIASGSNVYYAGGVADRDALDGTKYASKSDVRKLAAILESLNVPYFADGTYHCPIHPDMVLSLFTDDDLMKMAMAFPEAIKKGFIGQFANVSFFKTTNVPTVLNSSNKVCYQSVVYGADAFGTPDIDGKSVSMRTTNVDRMGRVKTMSWVGYFAAKRLEEARIVRFETNQPE